MGMIHIRLVKELLSAHGPLRLDVEFSLEKGSRTALFGASGSGKTTILRLLAGLERPEKGFIEVDGAVWLDTDTGVDWPPQRRRPGFVFQDYALFPNMTVEGNLRFALAGGPAATAAELLELTRLGALKDRYPSELSGGERQRLALARALARRPPLLLLDEPLSALDLETRLRLQGELLRLQGRYGTTVLLVGHDPDEIERLASRLLWLENGRIARDGPPDALLRPWLESLRAAGA